MADLVGVEGDAKNTYYFTLTQAGQGCNLASAASVSFKVYRSPDDTGSSPISTTATVIWPAEGYCSVELPATVFDNASQRRIRVLVDWGSTKQWFPSDGRVGLLVLPQTHARS